MAHMKVQDASSSFLKREQAKIELVKENSQLTKMMNDMKFRPRINKVRTNRQSAAMNVQEYEDDANLVEAKMEEAKNFSDDFRDQESYE